MKMRLLVAIVNDESSDAVLAIARDAGANGATVIPQARGGDNEGLRRLTGLDLDACQDVVLLLVPDAASAAIVNSLEGLGAFNQQPGSGILFQLDVEDSVGLRQQLSAPTASSERTGEP